MKWVVPSMCLVDCLERAPPHLDHDISAILIGVGLENSHLGVILAAVGFVTGRVVPPRVRGSRTVAGRGRRTSVVAFVSLPPVRSYAYEEDRKNKSIWFICSAAHAARRLP